MRRVFVLMLSFLCTSPALAGKACDFQDATGTCIDRADVEPIHLIRKGTPYVQARNKLIILGYQPGRGTYPPETTSCTPSRCETPPEILGCSGYDCRFLFNMGPSHYVVHTRGKSMGYAGASFMSDQEFATLQR